VRVSWRRRYLSVFSMGRRDGVGGTYRV
jgi:hypothetical protein